VPDIGHLLPYVENWLPNPAYIADRWWNVVVANGAARVLLGMDEGAFNILRDFFTRQRVRDRYPRCEETARVLVARFRSETAHYAADDQMRALISELYRSSRHFANLWDRHEVMEDSCGPEFLAYEGGELHGPLCWAGTGWLRSKR
jgi:hypothetical protein